MMCVCANPNLTDLANLTIVINPTSDKLIKTFRARKMQLQYDEVKSCWVK